MKSVATPAPLRSGEFARQSGVNLQTVRYYERIGLLPRAPRLPSGYRAFPADAIHRVRFIKRAQNLGFSLKEIQALLILDRRGRSGCAEASRLAQHHLQAIDHRIAQLVRMRKALVSLVDACSAPAGSSRNCPILASLDDGDQLDAD